MVAALVLGDAREAHGIVGGDCHTRATSHTFFSVRPQYQSGTPERITLLRDRMAARARDFCYGTVQLVPYTSVSREASSIGTFFMPFGSCALSVAYVGQGTSTFGKIPGALSQHFGIYPSGAAEGERGSFRSSISIAPRQTVFGFGMTYRQVICTLPACENFLWLEASAPIMHVRNKVHLCEAVDPHNGPLMSEANGASLPQNMTEAFKQPSWCYGRIDNCRHMDVTHLGDIELKVGYEWLKNGCCFFESYFGLLVPTGNRVTGRYVFEPMVGHNKHWGAMLGNSGIFEFRTWDSGSTLAFAIDINALYLADRVECRSLDLKYRPWSRYMQVYASKAQASVAADLARAGDVKNALILHTPGINVFTQPLRVSPRTIKTINTGFVFNHSTLQGEFGYNFYARDAECVKLAGPWRTGSALKAIERGAGTTNPYQTINHFIESSASGDTEPVGVQDYDKNLLSERDLDFESAAHPAVVTHTAYAAFGWHHDVHELPCFVGFGALYEMCDDNTGLNRWGLWLKGGVSF